MLLGRASPSDRPRPLVLAARIQKRKWMADTSSPLPRERVTPGVFADAPSAPARTSARGAKAAAMFAGALFLGLAGLQVFSVLSRPAGGALAEDLASLADPRTVRWILREDGKPDGRPR